MLQKFIMKFSDKKKLIDSLYKSGIFANPNVTLNFITTH